MPKVDCTARLTLPGSLGQAHLRSNSENESYCTRGVRLFPRACHQEELSRSFCPAGEMASMVPILSKCLSSLSMVLIAMHEPDVHGAEGQHRESDICRLGHCSRRSVDPERSGKSFSSLDHSQQPGAITKELGIHGAATNECSDLGQEAVVTNQPSLKLQIIIENELIKDLARLGVQVEVHRGGIDKVQGPPMFNRSV